MQDPDALKTDFRKLRRFKRSVHPAQRKARIADGFRDLPIVREDVKAPVQQGPSRLQGEETRRRVEIVVVELFRAAPRGLWSRLHRQEPLVRPGNVHHRPDIDPPCVRRHCR